MDVMKIFRVVVVLSLGISIGFLASGSFEVSQGVSAIAAEPGADANTVQGRQKRAFIQKRGWNKPHMQSESPLTTLMAQSMGRTCRTPSGKCEKEDPAPIGSRCLCDTETGNVVKGDGIAIDTKKTSTPPKDDDKDKEKDEAKKDN